MIRLILILASMAILTLTLFGAVAFADDGGSHVPTAPPVKDNQVDRPGESCDFADGKSGGSSGSAINHADSVNGNVICGGSGPHG